MTVNRYRGEVALPKLGEGAFICFDLEDLASIETLYGLQFFGKVEEVVQAQSAPGITKIMRIALRERRNGKVERIGEDFDAYALHQAGFVFGDLAKPILDALSESYLGKSYDDLVKAAVDARKEQMKATIAQAKEAAKESDVPFEALLSALLMPQTGQE